MITCLGLVYIVISFPNSQILLNNLYTSKAKKTPCISLFHLSYCSKVWRPRYNWYMVSTLESNAPQGHQVYQRRTTKYVLNEYSSNHKSRLLSLNLLLPMFYFKLNDIMFSHTANRCIFHHELCFIFTSATRSGMRKLVHKRSTNNLSHQFYFCPASILIYRILSNLYFF